MKTSESKPRRWPKWMWVWAGLAGALTLVAVAYWPKPVDVESQPVRRGTLVVTVVEDGMTRIRDPYTLSSPLQGELQRLSIEAGDRIERNQILARILPGAAPLLDPRSRSEAEARVEAARAASQRADAAVKREEADARLADMELARRKALIEAQVLAESEHDRLRIGVQATRADLAAARFAARVAAHELKLAEAALRRSSTPSGAVEELVIRSPVDGVVLEVFAESKVAVVAGTAILSVGDPEGLEVVVDVLTQDAVQIEPGAHATIDRWGGAGSIPARVRRVEPRAFTDHSALGVEEQRVNVLLDLDAPKEDWERLGDGFRVEVSIVIHEADEALLVPEAALFRRSGQWNVFQIVEGRARRVEVDVGLSNGREAQLLSGLSENDRVIVYPSDYVEDGVRVRTASPDAL
ncbi:MAG: efflux RND transporter periplasmic adaptor subunit [Myxococcota bacterium]